MPTAFCALDTAYGDWGKKDSKPSLMDHQLAISNQRSAANNTRGSAANGVRPAPAQAAMPSNDNMNAYSGSENSADLRSFCPNCNNCLNANNILQQKVIDQNIWPRPRWIPQHPQAYEMNDPYNRYWMDAYPRSHREDFGNAPFQGMFGGRENFGFGNTNSNAEGLLQLILFILIALFIIEMFKMIFRMCEPE